MGEPAVEDRQLNVRRRRELIEATITSIAERGLSRTTVAKVAQTAGLSQGIVNFYFKSKDALLLATLSHVTEGFERGWRDAIERSGPDPVEKLEALIDATFDESVCNPRWVAVWNAFWGEARARVDYMRVCGGRDAAHLEQASSLLRQIVLRGGDDRVDAEAVALAFFHLLSSLPESLLDPTQPFDREEARDTCRSFLASVFPSEFSHVAPSQPARGESARELGEAQDSAPHDWGVGSEYGRLCDVLLCSPENFRWLPTSSISRDSLQRGLELDPALARKQHDEMVQAYEEAGVRCHFLEPDPNLPYQVFARDSSFMTPYGGVVTQMAQWWRRGEYAPVIRFYRDNGIPIFNMVTAGSFEGGDFNMIAESCALIGYSGERTQEVAARQVQGWLEELGWEVELAPIAEHYVHIDLMVCMLAEKLAAVCLDIVDPAIVDWLASKKIELIPVGFRETMALGGNVLALGGDRVLSTARAADLNTQLRSQGFEVYDPDLSMFTLGGGGVHCLCQPLRRE